MAVLHTKPTGFASWNVRVLSGEAEITRLKISLIRSKGSFELDGDTFTIEPQGFFMVSAELRKGASVIARAEKASLTRRRFKITSAGHRLELESRSWTGREYVLLMGEKEVGTIRRSGFLGTKCELDFPDEVPVFLQIFLTYLAIAQAKREAAAAGSGS
jgi:hypothetical protein